MTTLSLKLFSDDIEEITDRLRGLDEDNPQVFMDLMFVAVSGMHLRGFDKGSIYDTVAAQIKIVEEGYKEEQE
jgi:hypothetical protein